MIANKKKNWSRFQRERAGGCIRSITLRSQRRQRIEESFRWQPRWLVTSFCTAQSNLGKMSRYSPSTPFKPHSLFLRALQITQQSRAIDVISPINARNDYPMPYNTILHRNLLLSISRQMFSKLSETTVRGSCGIALLSWNNCRVTWDKYKSIQEDWGGEAGW